MVLVKILGGIDFTASIALLLLIFGYQPPFQFLLFCAGLLLAKGFFILGGDILSIVDLAAAFILLIAIFFSPLSFILWALALLLLAKSLVSFI